MRFLVICLLLAGLAGCSCDDCCEDADCGREFPSKMPFYVNNSGVDVNLILVQETKQGEYIEGDTIYYRFTQDRFKQEMKNNDTLCNSGLNGKNCSREHWSTGAYGNCDFIPNYYYWCEEPAYFIIEFLSESKTCLIFDGDKIADDIRYWENYTLTEETSSYLMYYYTITPELRAMAKEENCPYE
jgi:hypothetical protein